MNKFQKAVCYTFTALLGLGFTAESWGQELRVKVTTAELLHGSDPFCIPMFNDAITLGGVIVYIGSETVETNEDWPDKGRADTQLLPGEYGVSIQLPEGVTGKIERVALEGLGIYMYPPHVRKTDFGDWIINLSAGSAKQPLGSGEWDYWLSIEVCLGVAEEGGDAPNITLITIPTTQVVGERNLYEIDYEDPNGDIVDLKLELALLSSELGWVDIPQLTKNMGPRGATGKTSGTMKVTSVCQRVGQAKLTYTLIDAAGNQSQPQTVTISCVAGAPSDDSDTFTGFVKKWAGRWTTDAFGMVNLVPVEDGRMTGVLEGMDGFLEGQLSPDGSTFSGNYFLPPSFSGEKAGEFEFALSPDETSLSGQWRSGESDPWSSISGTKDKPNGGLPPPTPPLPPTPPDSGQAPTITSVDIPDTLIQGQATLWQLGFNAPGGDVVLLQFEQWLNNVWQSTGSFDPGVSGQTQGQIGVNTTCNQLGTARVRVRVGDSANRFSDWSEYEYGCVDPSSAPPAGQGPTITSVGIPSTLQIDTPTSWDLSFSDANGDVVLVQFENWLDGQWQSSGEFDPEVFGQMQGQIGVNTTCRIAGNARVRVTLVDQAGNRDSAEYVYECRSNLGSPSPGGMTIAEALDANLNRLLDDPEIRKAIQYWIMGEAVPGAGETIDDVLIRALIQMWIMGNPVTQGTQAQPVALLQPLQVHAIQLRTPDPLRRTLSIDGVGIVAARIRVFDLGGRLLLESENGGPMLRLTLLNSRGQPLANGVYLYAVSVKGINDEVWHSRVRKLVVLR